MAKIKQPEKSRSNARSEIEEFKEFLGPVAAQYSDRELPQLRREMYAMAEFLLDLYLYKKTRSDNPHGTTNFDTPVPRL